MMQAMTAYLYRKKSASGDLRIGQKEIADILCVRNSCTLFKEGLSFNMEDSLLCIIFFPFQAGILILQFSQPLVGGVPPFCILLGCLEELFGFFGE